MPSRLKCFIAMAFGKDDCDKIYENSILPTLKELKVDPIRVDRREHREDLNNYIIKMLKTSHFALADLTYARPSVYYEAGFAERSIPIVYTARADHLSRAQSDDSLRVHFDLEMKKIVSWKDRDDRSFSKRLRKRVKFLIEPLLRDRKAEEKIRREEDFFHSLSNLQQLELIGKSFDPVLKAKHFWVRRLEEISKHSNYEPPFYGAQVIIGLKKVGRTCFACIIYVGSGVTKKEIKQCMNWISGIRFALGRASGIEAFNDFYCFCSPNGIPESRLTSTFPSATPNREKGLFQFSHRTYGDQRRNVYVRLMPKLDSKVRIAGHLRAFSEFLDGKRGDTIKVGKKDKSGKIMEIVFKRRNKDPRITSPNRIY